MRRMSASLSRRARPLTARLRRATDRALVLLARVWRWLDSIELPLSPLQWIIATYLIFGVIYALATPVFEANDELWHFGYVQHLRDTGELPTQVFDGRDSIYRQHGSQPPLYYGLMALLTTPFSMEDVEEYRRLNPHVSAKEPDAFGNKNLILHDAAHSRFGGTGLVVLVMRISGLLVGVGTIVCVFKIGDLVAPQRPAAALVAAAIAGLNPMFIFVSASVNNDSLSAALNAALMLSVLRMLRDGFSLRASALTALLFALSFLTKMTVVVLLPVVVGAGFYILRKTRDQRGLLTLLMLLALLWLAIAGWWTLRNIQLYGEPLGLVTMANIAGPRGMTFNTVQLLSEYQQFRMSFWGLFGAQNIPITSVFYVVLDLATLLAAGGCIFLVLQLLAISDFAYARYELAHLLTLLSALGLLWLGVLYWSTLTPALEGRILFPLISVVSPVLAVGLVETVWWLVFSLRPPNLEFVRAGDAVPKELLQNAMNWQLRFLGVVALLAPFTVIASHYTVPQPVDSPPGNARPIYAQYGDVALIAYERIDRRYNAGDRVRLKLYWQVLQPSAVDNSVGLSLVDDRGNEIGHYLTYPGAGSLRTSRWQAGAIYPDEYLISIYPAAHGRYPFDLLVEWTDGLDSTSIVATDADGATIAPVLLDVGAVVTARYQTAPTGFNEIPLDAQPVFDNVIRLEAFQLDLDLNEITLSWKAETAPDENYTVFVHLLDPAGGILSQADAAPRLPTKYWRWGETYTTHHRLPPTHAMIEHDVIVGLYLYDGLTYPKAEYTLEATAEPENPLDAADMGTPVGLAAIPSDGDEPPPTGGASEDSLDDDTLTDDGDETDDVQDVYDSFLIPWGSAAEVLALTPTPEPTSEGEMGSADGAPATAAGVTTGLGD